MRSRPCPCPNAAIVRSRISAYQADYAKFVAACPKVEVVDCPVCPPFSAECIGRTCGATFIDEQPSIAPVVIP
jgi:hypothetical protein